MDIMVVFVVLQTILLCALWALIREWAGNINRKLHRIESNTRHTAKAVGYSEKEETAEES